MPVMVASSSHDYGYGHDICPFYQHTRPIGIWDDRKMGLLADRHLLPMVELDLEPCLDAPQE